jgi:hypothetical protein
LPAGSTATARCRLRQLYCRPLLNWPISAARRLRARRTGIWRPYPAGMPGQSWSNHSPWLAMPACFECCQHFHGNEPSMALPRLSESLSQHVVLVVLQASIAEAPLTALCSGYQWRLHCGNMLKMWHIECAGTLSSDDA